MLYLLIIMIIVWIAFGIWGIDTDYEINIPFIMFCVLTVILFLLLKEFFK